MYNGLVLINQVTGVLSQLVVDWDSGFTCRRRYPGNSIKLDTRRIPTVEQYSGNVFTLFLMTQYIHVSNIRLQNPQYNVTFILSKSSLQDILPGGHIEDQSIVSSGTALSWLHLVLADEQEG